MFWVSAETRIPLLASRVNLFLFSLPECADASLLLTATLFHCWTATTHLIRSIDAANLTLTLHQSPHVSIERCEHASGKRFYIEDAIEYLDEPGEFYYDRQTRKLTYLPLENERLEDFEAMVPQLITPISIEAAHVTVKELSVLHAAADMDGFFVGDCDGQSASNLKTGAVALSCNCTGITVENVEVAHTGGFGFILQGNLHDATLSRLQVSLVLVTLLAVLLVLLLVLLLLLLTLLLRCS